MITWLMICFGTANISTRPTAIVLCVVNMPNKGVSRSRYICCDWHSVFFELCVCKIYEGDDWRRVCTEATSAVLDRLQRMYICATVGEVLVLCCTT